ncbi:MAG: hypothetical protein LBG19_06790 [Prevotellaceae bacterium]|jgi:alanyl-tRNA synthetase|nr:hypothetical protein [Prevotellaceae bacterium]
MGEKDYNAPMHSAEHILNGTMDKLFNCGRAFSSHVERKKSKCDYHFERPLREEELQQLENKVNEVIAQHFEVTEDFISRDEAEKLFNFSRLPESAGEMLRIIRIGDYDACPCIGMHVQNTSEIGKFKIISSDYKEGVLRIRFKREDNN